VPVTASALAPIYDPSRGPRGPLPDGTEAAAVWHAAAALPRELQAVIWLARRGVPTADMARGDPDEQRRLRARLRDAAAALSQTLRIPTTPGGPT
jgi:hypothetical protein